MAGLRDEAPAALGSHALACGLHGSMKPIRTLGPLAARLACRGPLCGPSVAGDLGWLACGTKAPGGVDGTRALGGVHGTRRLLLSVVTHSRGVCTAL